MTIQTTYTGELHTECKHIQSGSVLHTDAPTDNQGKGENFSPTDLLATAAASCVITFISIRGREENIDFEGTVLETTKIMTKEPPRKIAKLEMKLRMKTSRKLNGEEKTKYEELGRNCPVILSLHPDVRKEMDFLWE